MKGLSVIGRIWDFILRAWETVAGFQHWKWEWKKQRGMQWQVEGEAEAGAPEAGKEGTRMWASRQLFWFQFLVLVPCETLLQPLPRVLCDGPFGHSVASTALGTGPHTAANEIDYDPLCVDGDSWASKRVDKTFNLRKCCEENKAG